jgi:hypothetical protein
MALVEGHPAPPTRIPGIPCSPPPAAWWQSATVGSLLAAGLAVVAALLAFVPLRARFGFQGSTAG